MEVRQGCSVTTVTRLATKKRFDTARRLSSQWTIWLLLLVDIREISHMSPSSRVTKKSNIRLPAVECLFSELTLCELVFRSKHSDPQFLSKCLGITAWTNYLLGEILVRNQVPLCRFLSPLFFLRQWLNHTLPSHNKDSIALKGSWNSNVFWKASQAKLRIRISSSLETFHFEWSQM